MKPTISAFLLALLAMAFGAAPATAEKVRCSAIRDSAMCVAEPSCWYDVHGGGCTEGKRPEEDACGVHESESICAGSTLGCVWDGGSKKCVTKSN
jgi:hypothetical protein